MLVARRTLRAPLGGGILIRASLLSKAVGSPTNHFRGIEMVSLNRAAVRPNGWLLDARRAGLTGCTLIARAGAQVLSPGLALACDERRRLCHRGELSPRSVASRCLRSVIGGGIRALACALRLVSHDLPNGAITFAPLHPTAPCRQKKNAAPLSRSGAERHKASGKA